MIRLGTLRSRAALVRARWLGAMAVSVFSTASLCWLTTDATIVHAHRAGTSPATFSRIADVPSHNARYVASLVPSSTPPRLGQPLEWTLVVRTADGVSQEHASLAVESWMPDDSASGSRSYATRELGAGRYRVDGLRFDRPGWWNVRLRVSAAGATDSLAFNLVF